jgi:hypothetical protein
MAESKAVGPERYLPMLRLLDGSDLQFLRRQPGFTPAMEVRFRSQRCRAALGYLGCLRADFAGAAPALGKRIRFAVRLAQLRCRIALYERGHGTVDFSGLIQNFR